MSNQKNRRWRLIADPNIQGWLCFRIAAYWICCQVMITVTLLGFAHLQAPGDLTAGSVWKILIPALVVSSLAMPIAVLDVIAFSNKFVGPVYQLKRKLAALASGEEIDEVHFRVGDYHAEAQPHLNQIREMLMATPSECCSTTADDESRIPVDTCC